MRVFYNIGIAVYTFLIWMAAFFNKKARLWIRGRRNWYDGLKKDIKTDGKWIWLHCASLGEFEQGRPLIEAIKKEKPDYRILLTFFSPSGYEIRKNYQLADKVCYLPADTGPNSRKFISTVNPAIAVFIKYEFWNNYLTELKSKGIPTYLISGIFSENHHFFRWYGKFFRRILKNFTWLFVQDRHSADILRKYGIENVSLAGDTRFDRVVQISQAAKEIPQLEKFRGKERLFLAGSSWRQDEEIIASYINRHPENMKWIFAPHEIEAGNIERLRRLFRVKTVRFSEFNDESCDARVMIIDNIGMLSSAYRYAYVAAVGGGFGRGIHNILEPACWGIPVMFGPRHTKFREAVELVRDGGAMTFSDYEDFSRILNTLISDKALYNKTARTAGSYVRENTGATAKIMSAML